MKHQVATIRRCAAHHARAAFLAAWWVVAFAQGGAARAQAPAPAIPAATVAAAATPAITPPPVPAVPAQSPGPALPPIPVSAAAPAAATPEGPRLRVTVPGQSEEAIPVTTLGAARYISITQMNTLLRRIQPDARIDWNASTGVYRATVQKNDFSLFRDQNLARINNSMIQGADPLRPGPGQVFVPLTSIERILGLFEGVTTNARDLLSPAATPTAATAGPSPSSTATPLYIATPGAGATPAVRRTPTATPAVAVPREEPNAAGADSASIADLLRLLTGQKSNAAAPRELAQSLRAAAAEMQVRHTVVIDPEPNARLGAGGAAGDAPDLTLDVAQRCAKILAPHAATLGVVVTRAPGQAAGTLDERVDTINTADAKALVCLRIDWSEFPENGGYRLFAMHEAVDPEALQRRGSPDAAPAGGATLPQALTYLPFENVNLVLARCLGRELDDSGQTAASPPLVLAPHYLLRRAAMPAVTLTLGSWTCDADRARMSQSDYADAAARSLAQALLRYDDWLRAMAAGRVR